jgi:hypothetical protein
MRSDGTAEVVSSTEVSRAGKRASAGFAGVARAQRAAGERSS